MYIANNAVDIDTGLNQSAVTLASLTIDQSYIGKIGTATAYLQVGATLCTVGNPGQGIAQAAGSPRIKIDFGSVQTAVTVVNTNTQTSTDTGLAPLRFIGTHASNTCTVLGGRVGWAATAPGETSTIATLKVAGASAIVTTGSGVTLTTISLSAGKLSINSAATTITQTGGTLTTGGSGAVTTLTTSGMSNLNSTGTITTMNLQRGGTANFNGNPTARTVTTFKVYGGKVLDSLAVVTFTNGLALQQIRLADIDKATDVGANRTYTLS